MRTLVAIDKFLVSRRAQQATPNTISGYEWALGKMLEMFPDELPSSRTDMDEVLAGHSDLALASLQGLWRKLRTFWIWAESEGIAENFMARISAPPNRTKLPRTLSDDETARLLASTKDRRDYAIIVLLLDTGMRVGEAASISRSSITSVGILVSGKTGERIVPVSPPILKLLRRQGEGDAVWVAHNGKKGPMTASGLQQAVRKAMVRAGLRPPKLGPHMLRHTFARKYLVNGGDIPTLQAILGHSNLRSTMIYASMNIDLVAQQHSRFSPMANVHIPGRWTGQSSPNIVLLQILSIDPSAEGPRRHRTLRRNSAPDAYSYTTDRFRL